MAYGHTLCLVVISFKFPITGSELDQFLGISLSFMTMTFLKMQSAHPCLLLFQLNVPPSGFVWCFLVTRFRCCPHGRNTAWVILCPSQGNTRRHSMSVIGGGRFLPWVPLRSDPCGGKWEFASRWSSLSQELGVRRHVIPNACPWGPRSLPRSSQLSGRWNKQTHSFIPHHTHLLSTCVGWNWATKVSWCLPSWCLQSSREDHWWEDCCVPSI